MPHRRLFLISTLLVLLLGTGGGALFIHRSGVPFAAGHPTRSHPAIQYDTGIGTSQHKSTGQSHTQAPRPLQTPSPTLTPKPQQAAKPPRALKPQTKVAASPKAKYMVLIVLDGAQPSYLFAPNIPHVKALMQNGTRYTNAFAGILESETPSGHAAIDSGSSPNKDGILSFDWANSDNIPVSLFNETAINSGQMDRIMKSSPAPSIASLVHKQNPKAKVVALSGYKYYAADALGGPDADVIMYYNGRANGTFGPTGVPRHMPPQSVLTDPSLVLPNRGYALGAGNHMAMKLASKTFQTMHQQVTLINLPEFDWPLGHNWGASRDQKDMQTLMRGFDADLAMLENTYRKAGVLDQTLFVLTADHGFAPIDHKVSHTIVNNAVAAAGTSIIRDTYHTASYVWIKDESKASQIASALSATQNSYVQSVYFRLLGANGPYYVRATGADQFRTSGMEAANQYLLSTFNGPNGPDLVVFMKENSAFVAGAESSWKGDHGGAAWKSQHLPLLISGPGVRKGYTSNSPVRLIDIAPTALSLMGIPSTGMQGIVLADAQQTPTAAAQSAQKAQAAALGPIVLALQRQSQLEVQAGQ